MNENNLYNLNIERAVLSAVLFDPILIEEVFITSSDFFLPFHKHFFDAMQELYTTQKPIDESFITTILKKHNNYDEIAFLDLMTVNAISDINAYSEELIEYSRKRSLSGASTMIKKALIEDGESSEDVIAKISKTIENIDNKTESEMSIDEMSDNFLGIMDKARENNGVVGIRTGIAELDKLDVIGKAGDLFVIGARPSVGKTALATSMMANMIDRGEHILFSSLDMPYDLLMLRLVSILSGETIWDLKRGVPRDRKAVGHALKRIKEHITIHNEKNISWNKIKAKSKRTFRKNKKITVWFLDHIGKIAYKDPMFRRFEIGEVTSGAKAMGEEMGVLPILLTQLNRDSVNRVGNRPNLGDLKESGAIEEDATHVILPHRESYHNKSNNEREADITDAELIVAKNQTGPTGVARCKFYGKFTKFSDDNGYEVIYEDDGSSLKKSDNTISVPRVLG